MEKQQKEEEVVFATQIDVVLYDNKSASPMRSTPTNKKYPNKKNKHCHAVAQSEAVTTPDDTEPHTQAEEDDGDGTEGE